MSISIVLKLYGYHNYGGKAPRYLSTSDNDRFASLTVPADIIESYAVRRTAVSLRTLQHPTSMASITTLSALNFHMLIEKS